MRAFLIFDCTREVGGEFRITGWRWMAHLVAVLASWATGRFHDFTPA